MTISGLLTRIEAQMDDRFSNLRLRAQRLDELAHRGQSTDDAAKCAHDRLSEFRKHLDEARFFDTRFDELDPASACDASCREARAGLCVFGSGAAGDAWMLDALGEELSDREKDEVKKGFYELLLILADGVAQSPGDPAGSGPSGRWASSTGHRASVRRRRGPITCAARSTSR